VAREMFATNRDRFDDVFQRLRGLEPHYLPRQPGSLRALSSVVGYRRAEQVALWWRRAKAVSRRP
jgi:hypothetical protein